MSAIFDAILNKGGAGTTISRRETISALNPLLEAHARLLNAYAYVRSTLPEAALPVGTAELLRTARMDAGKLSETVLSNGGVSYSGTALEPGTERIDGPTGQVLRGLIEREQAVLDTVRASLGDVDHHIRTKAILGNLVAHSEERLTALREALRQARD